MYKFVIIFYLILLFSACYDKIYIDECYSHRGYTNYNNLESFLGDSSFLVFDNDEKIPDSSIFEESIEIKSSPQDNVRYSTVFILLQQSKKEARKIGANVMKIINVGETDSHRGFHVIAKLYKLSEPYLSLYNKTIAKTDVESNNFCTVYIKNYW